MFIIHLQFLKQIYMRSAYVYSKTKLQRRKRKLLTSLPSNLRPRRLVQSQARGCERASKDALRFALTPAQPASRPKSQAQITTSPPVPSPRSSFPSRRPPPAAIEAAPITKGGPHPLSSELPRASAPNPPRAPFGRRPCDGFGSVDLQGQGGPAPRRARAPDPLRIR